MLYAKSNSRMVISDLQLLGMAVLRSVVRKGWIFPRSQLTLVQIPPPSLSLGKGQIRKGTSTLTATATPFLGDGSNFLPNGECVEDDA